MRDLSRTPPRAPSSTPGDPPSDDVPSAPGEDERRTSPTAGDGNLVARHSLSPSLSVGVLLDDRQQERWVLEAVRRVLTLPRIRLAAVAVSPEAPARASIARVLHLAVDAVDRGLRCRREALFAKVDAVVGLAAPRELTVARSPRIGPRWALDPEAVSLLAGLDIDIWLCFAMRPPSRPFPRISRFGVLGLEIGVDTSATNRWAGAGEIAGANTLTTTALVDYAATNGTAIRQTRGATVTNSARANRLRAVCKALPMCAHAVAAVLRGSTPASAVYSAPIEQRALPSPSSSAVVRLAGTIARSVAANRWRELRWREQWQIAYYFRDSRDERFLATERLRYLLPPADRYWADPFAIERDGRHFIFFEELLFGAEHGRICAIEVFKNREPGAPLVVIERPHHLSYPSFFTWRNVLYMLPETGALGSLVAYRCVEFPLRWTPYAILLAGAHAYDATLWCDGRRWWLFANVAQSGADPSDELCLFFGDTPFGPWAPHPANPIVADVRYARSAGPIFNDRGATYRPSQDCSESYGRTIVINRIDCLTAEEYRETRVARIAADWRPDARGVHTYGRGRLQVIDCLVRRSRWGTGGRLSHAGSGGVSAPPAPAGGAESTTGGKPVA